MRLNAEAVICDRNKNWYYGTINGFSFFVKAKIKTNNFFKDPDRFKSVTSWLKEIGYEKEYVRLTKTLLKSIIVKQKHQLYNKSINYERGALKLFIGKTVNIAELDNANYNVLCANCIWTCMQPKKSQIINCKAFKNENPN